MNNKGFATPMIVVWILTLILGTVFGFGIYRYMENKDAEQSQQTQQVIVETQE